VRGCPSFCDFLRKVGYPTKLNRLHQSDCSFQETPHSRAPHSSLLDRLPGSLAALFVTHLTLLRCPTTGRGRLLHPRGPGTFRTGSLIHSPRPAMPIRRCQHLFWRSAAISSASPPLVTRLASARHRSARPPGSFGVSPCAHRRGPPSLSGPWSSCSLSHMVCPEHPGHETSSPHLARSGGWSTSAASHSRRPARPWAQPSYFALAASPRKRHPIPLTLGRRQFG